MSSTKAPSIFAGEKPPLVLYLDNIVQEVASRAERRLKRTQRRGGLVLGDGTRIPTARGRIKAVSVLNLVHDIDKLSKMIEEKRLRIYTSMAKDRELTASDLAELKSPEVQKRLRTMLVEAPTRAAELKDKEFVEKERLHRIEQVKAAKDAAQQAEKHADVLNERAESLAAFHEADLQLLSETPDTETVERILDAFETAPWAKGIRARLDLLYDALEGETEEPKDDEKGPTDVAVQEAMDRAAADAKKVPESAVQEGGKKEPELAPPPSEEPEVDETPAVGEDDGKEYTLDDLMKMKRSDLNRIAAENGVTDATDEVKFPTKRALAETLLQHAGESAQKGKE